MADRKLFQLGQKDWLELSKLVEEVGLMRLLALPPGSGGRDLRKLAMWKLKLFWERMGAHYGFDPKTVEPADEAGRTIAAESAGLPGSK